MIIFRNMVPFACVAVHNANMLFTSNLLSKYTYKYNVASMRRNRDFNCLVIICTRLCQKVKKTKEPAGNRFTCSY